MLRQLQNIKLDTFVHDLTVNGKCLRTLFRTLYFPEIKHFPCSQSSTNDLWNGRRQLWEKRRSESVVQGLLGVRAIVHLIIHYRGIEENLLYFPNHLFHAHNSEQADVKLVLINYYMIVYICYFSSHKHNFHFNIFFLLRYGNFRRGKTDIYFLNCDLILLNFIFINSFIRSYFISIIAGYAETIRYTRACKLNIHVYLLFSSI